MARSSGPGTVRTQLGLLSALLVAISSEHSPCWVHPAIAEGQRSQGAKKAAPGPADDCFQEVNRLLLFFHIFSKIFLRFGSSTPSALWLRAAWPGGRNGLQILCRPKSGWQGPRAPQV